MTDHQATATPPNPEPGVRAARQRLGLSQDQAADLIGANRSTFKTWDRDRRKPRDPEMVQAVAEALQTPIDVLWPPEKNPHVARTLEALRERRAHEEAQERYDEPKPATELAWERPAQPNVPNPRDVLRTLNGEDGDPSGARAARPRRLGTRVLAPLILGLVALIAGTTIAAAGDDKPTEQPAAVATGPTAAEAKRSAQRAALDRARDRGDFDAAITVAADLRDPVTVSELRDAAGAVLARRARAAAERGDLSLATSRLTRAENRYGTNARTTAVGRRIDAIKDARKARAAKRRRDAAAQRKAAAQARLAASASRTAAPVARATPSPQSSTAAPAPSARTPTPAPKPAPSSGSSGGSGGGSKSGGASEKAVDPGIF